MWMEIINDNDIMSFMDKVGNFHDGCIKEMRYYSGAYVDEQKAMYPINDKRILFIAIQRQSEKFSMIEMQFVGLNYLSLFPENEEYTCEIYDSKLYYNNGCIYWCDREMSIKDMPCEGTMVCASKLLWRVIDNGLGENLFYGYSNNGD